MSEKTTMRFYISVGKIEKTIEVSDAQLNDKFMPKLWELKNIITSDPYNRDLKIEIEPNGQWAICHNGIIAEGFCLGTISLALTELILIYKEWRT
jgi:hypothetical protein